MADTSKQSSCPICGTEGWCLTHGYPTGVSWKEDPEKPGQFFLDVRRDGWQIEARVGGDDGVDFYAAPVRVGHNQETREDA
jgi:hypothetical protein